MYPYPYPGPPSRLPATSRPVLPVYPAPLYPVHPTFGGYPVYQHSQLPPDTQLHRDPFGGQHYHIPSHSPYPPGTVVLTTEDYQKLLAAKSAYETTPPPAAAPSQVVLTQEAFEALMNRDRPVSSVPNTTAATTHEVTPPRYFYKQ